MLLKISRTLVNLFCFHSILDFAPRYFPDKKIHPLVERLYFQNLHSIKNKDNLTRFSRLISRIEFDCQFQKLLRSCTKLQISESFRFCNNYRLLSCWQELYFLLLLKLSPLYTPFAIADRLYSNQTEDILWYVLL